MRLISSSGDHRKTLITHVWKICSIRECPEQQSSSGKMEATLVNGPSHQIWDPKKCIVQRQVQCPRKARQKRAPPIMTEPVRKTKLYFTLVIQAIHFSSLSEVMVGTVKSIYLFHVDATSGIGCGAIPSKLCSFYFLAISKYSPN